jgi:hypothetical protein
MGSASALVTCVVLGLLPAGLSAQDARLASRLDPRTRLEVQQVVDSAKRVGLPTEPLLDKALEGAAKRADGGRIVWAVRTLAGGLQTARASLGPTSDEADLVAGAEALRAGVSSQALAELRASRGKESVLTPLAVLSDLVSRGVPADSAAAAILRLAERGATDADFGTLQQEVENDIRAGASPGAAASARTGGQAGSASDKPAAQGPKNPKGPKEHSQHPPKDRPPKERSPKDKAPKDKPPKDHSSHGNPADKP